MRHDVIREMAGGDVAARLRLVVAPDMFTVEESEVVRDLLRDYGGAAGAVIPQSDRRSWLAHQPAEAVPERMVPR